jgi:methylated-DNA-[protein]-cysteine S-methyltransferase
MTYGEVAKQMGDEPMRARDVGQALSRNPFAPIVPCHRVVAAGGRLGGYSAPGGTATKRRLLELEGADIVAQPQQRGLFDDLAP